MSQIGPGDLMCDACEASTSFTPDPVRGVRVLAFESGWSTGLASSAGLPSRHDFQVDLCPACAAGHGEAVLMRRTEV